jgi:hypothetical protein
LGWGAYHAGEVICPGTDGFTSAAKPFFSAGEHFLPKSPENLQQISKLVAARRYIFTISLMAGKRP